MTSHSSLILAEMSKTNQLSKNEPSDINNSLSEEWKVEIRDIIGKWILSDERDPDWRIRIYEPWGSSIYFTEGMRGIEFRDNNEFVMYDFDEADMPTINSGKYRLEGSVIEVLMENNDLNPISLKVISVDNNRLKVKVLDYN